MWGFPSSAGRIFFWIPIGITFVSLLGYLKLAGNHSWTSSLRIIALYAGNGPSAEPFEPIFSAFFYQVTINLLWERIQIIVVFFYCWTSIFGKRQRQMLLELHKRHGYCVSSQRSWMKLFWFSHSRAMFIRPLIVLLAETRRQHGVRMEGSFSRIHIFHIEHVILRSHCWSHCWK